MMNYIKRIHIILVVIFLITFSCTVYSEAFIKTYCKDIMGIEIENLDKNDLSSTSLSDFILSTHNKKHITHQRNKNDLFDNRAIINNPNIILADIHGGNRETQQIKEKGAKDNNKQALDYYKKALEHYGSFHRSKNIDILEKGLKIINKSINLNSTYLEAYYLKGLMLLMLNKTEDAISTLNSGINIKTDINLEKKVTLYTLRGMIKHKTGQSKDCLDDYKITIHVLKKTLIDNRNDIGNIAYFAQVMFLMGTMNEGLIFLQKMNEKHPQNRVLKKRINVYRKEMNIYKQITIKQFLETLGQV